MCGRFLSVSNPEQLAERFDVDEVRTQALPPRFNVAPSMDVYAVIERRGTRRLGTLHWGFVAPWADRGKRSREPINARVESLTTSGMFRSAFEERRCLLPADGFYEWQDRGDGRRKQPFYLSDPEGLPFAFAGLWSVWGDRHAPGTDDPLFSTAIVTREATGAMERIHPRMPAILPQSLWRDWLTASPNETPHLVEALAAVGPPRLVATPVTGRVNDVRNEGPELIEPGSIEDGA